MHSEEQPNVSYHVEHRRHLNFGDSWGWRSCERAKLSQSTGKAQPNAAAQYLDAVRRTRDVIKKANTTSFLSFISELNMRSDSTKFRWTVHSLVDKHTKSSSDTVLQVENTAHLSDELEANAVMKEHELVSHLHPRVAVNRHYKHTVIYYYLKNPSVECNEQRIGYFHSSLLKNDVVLSSLSLT